MIDRAHDARSTSRPRLRYPRAPDFRARRDIAMTTPLRIHALEAHPLNARLHAPFVTATGRRDSVENVAVCVRLASGVTGWGEIPPLPPITAEDQALALAAVERCATWLPGRDAGQWRLLARELAEREPGLAASRAGIEMAIVDALCRVWGAPLYRFVGGVGDTVITDITIPICPPDEAETLARGYAAAGFSTIKTKVGLDVDADVERLRAIRRGHPGCQLIVDANEGYSADDALRALRTMRQAGIEPALFEQPVARADWDGLGRVTAEGGVAVAADESCRTPEDALAIARKNLATVVNIKIAKSGLAAALDIAAIARAAGIGLMIGGMVETRIAMGFSAHVAAGLGGFDFIDLDTPLLLAEDPVRGGYAAEGPVYRLAGVTAGHGGEPAACR
jgi:L-alanine-DL-glutamate epimerase-like enolase superfamily enzyme